MTDKEKLKRGYVGIKNLEKLIPKLKEAKHSATMETMSLHGGIADIINVKLIGGEINEFIKEKTELYRNTWIVTPLQEVIEELEKFL